MPVVALQLLLLAHQFAKRRGQPARDQARPCTRPSVQQPPSTRFCRRTIRKTPSDRSRLLRQASPKFATSSCHAKPVFELYERQGRAIVDTSLTQNVAQNPQRIFDTRVGAEAVSIKGAVNDSLHGQTRSITCPASSKTWQVEVLATVQHLLYVLYSASLQRAQRQLKGRAEINRLVGFLFLWVLQVVRTR